MNRLKKNSTLRIIPTLLCILLFFISCNHALEFFKEKPSFIKTCRINEPEFTKCSTEQIQLLMTTVGKGVPELKGILPRLDPMHLDKLELNNANSEVANLKATLKDINLTGFSDIVIKESRVSKKDFSWLTHVYIPKFKINAKYKMDGRILLLPLQGEGHMTMVADDVKITLRTKTILIEKEGLTFYNVTEITMDLDVGQMQTQFDNLFGENNEEITRSANESFNKNWRDLFEAFRPVIIQSVESVLFDILRKLFLIYPANFFVEDIPTPAELYSKKS